MHDASSGGNLPPRKVKHGSKKRKGLRTRLLWPVLIAIIAAAFAVVWWIAQDRPLMGPFQDDRSSVDETAKPPSARDESQAPNDRDAAPPADTGTAEDDKTDGAEKEDREAAEGEKKAEKSPECKEESRVVYHKVKKGETLFRITMNYYGNKDYLLPLAAYNGIDDPRHIEAGQTIRIPLPPPFGK